MNRYRKAAILAAAGLLFACATAQAQQPDDPCAAFSWDVSAIRAALAERPESIAAAANRSQPLPEIAVDTSYELDLLPQSEVKFDIGPGKPTLDDGSTAGLVRFRVPSNGHYRVAITSPHWIDVLDGDMLMRTIDFQGSHGCIRPRKIVEFELAAERDLILQLSGGVDPVVTIVIATVTADTNPTADHGTEHH